MANYFIRRFVPLKDRGDYVIAPQALSSYYIEGSGGRVGASWMTKNNRLDEIEDYLGYLTKVYTMILESNLDHNVEINVLGFSQGVATAVRWACSDNIKINRLILWSGSLPKHELSVQHRNFSTYFIYGEQDEYLKNIDTDEQKALLDKHLSPFIVDTFDGIHEVGVDQLNYFSDKYKW